VHERIVHFIEVATTHWLGGQHGEEGKEGEGEEDEAQSEALSRRRRSLRRPSSKTSSTDPASFCQ
jgi:hypothetical protein